MMNEMLGETEASEICLEEMDACIEFASAIKIINENRRDIALANQPKVDFVIDRLSKELDGRLRKLSSAMHEQFVRSHPLTVIGFD